MKARVSHLSSAHVGLDTRIFLKQCVSLAAAGFDTHLVITATTDDVHKAAGKGVTVHTLNAPVGRFSRIVMKSWRCFVVSRRINADIYHFHDPELMPYGILLALLGKKVVYDVHEDVPKDILTKEWIASWIRKSVALTISAIEHFGARYFFSVIAATPFIRDRFRTSNPNTVDINNFPLLEELVTNHAWEHKHAEVCYVGGISRIRGIQEVCQAMSLVKSGVRLNLCGKFSSGQLELAVKAMPGWQRVIAPGFVNRDGVREILSRSMAGLVTLHPLPNYVDAQPIKMFEYMSAGIPVIASDFPLWREIIEGCQCGLVVDPLNPESIAEAIDYLVTHPQEARRMGVNGRKAVEERYNWNHEEKKLLDFYARTLGMESAGKNL